MPKSPLPWMLLLTSAAGFSDRTASSNEETSHRSALLRRIRSAVATARFASKAPGPDDSNNPRPLTPSTTHTTPSNTTGDSSASSSHRPAATGPGSATPDSSTTIASKLVHFWTSPSKADASSPFVEQQTQPFRNSTIRPSASSADAPANNVSRPRVSPNSFSTTAIFKF